jgi:branched-chain amino acid aminotransferase
MEITPINSVDKYKINNGFQGDITKKMHIDYLNIVYGRCNNKYNWLTQIYD